MLPVAVSGVDDVAARRGGRWRRSEIIVRYGVPFELDLVGRRDDPAIADEIAARIAELLPPARRGVYAAAGPPGR